MRLARTCLGKLELTWTEPRCLNADGVGEVPEGLPGVYALMAFSRLYPSYLIYYIGQSADLRRRLTEHQRSPRPFLAGVHRNLPTYFAAARVSHPAFRTAAEAALIRLFDPVGNDQIPIALAVAVNPPPTNILPDE